MTIERSVHFLPGYQVSNITVNLAINGSNFLLTSVNGWIVIQQRVGATTGVFGVSWVTYRNGFGTYNSTFWLGLELVYLLTSSASYQLRIEIQALANYKWFSTEYSSFYVDNEALKYTIHVSGYTGDAGDVFNSIGGTLMNGMKFSTMDQDNDLYKSGSCSTLYGGGWWYNNCMYGCLTGEYFTTSASNFYWHPMTDLGISTTYNLVASRMMIKMN